MNDDWFDRIEADLAQLTRQGAHLEPKRAPSRRRELLARRVVAAIALSLALSVSLIGEFPSVATGRPLRAGNGGALRF